MKIKNLVIILTLFAISTITTLAEPIIINNKRIQVESKLVGNRKLLPLRELSSVLGLEVVWDKETGNITVKSTDVALVMNVKNKYAFKNGKKVELEVPPTMIDNKTYLPLRFVAEMFGYNVEFNDGVVSLISGNVEGGEKMLKTDKDCYDFLMSYVDEIETVFKDVENGYDKLSPSQTQEKIAHCESVLSQMSQFGISGVTLDLYRAIGMVFEDGATFYRGQGNNGFNESILKRRDRITMSQKNVLELINK